MFHVGAEDQHLPNLKTKGKSKTRKHTRKDQ